jgi:predicted dehydrogenase
MPFRVGLVGVEQHVSHVLQGIQQANDIQLAAIARAGTRAEELATQFGAKVYPDYPEMLAQEKLDAVAVCLVPRDQGQVVLAALRAGFHAIADKPLVITQQELDTLVAEVHRNPHLKVGMLFTLRGIPSYVKLREVVQRGQIGSVVQSYGLRAAMEKRATRAPWFFDSRLSGGPVPDLLIHDLDAIRWTTGLEYLDITAWEANHARPEFPHYHNAGQVFCRMERSTSAILEHHRLVPPTFGGMDYRLKVVGTLGQVELTPKGTVLLYTEQLAGEVTPLPSPQNVFADFVRAACTGKEPLVDTQGTLQSMQVALSAVASAEQGKTVPIPRVGLATAAARR